MPTKKQKPPKVARKLALALAKAGAKGQVKKLAAMLKAIESAGDAGKPGTWEYYARRFRLWLAGGMTGETPFSIFRAGGNKKLPFFTFSSLPGFDCPGKGDCLFWCYSFKAWRYPAAFFRQLQNSMLLRSKHGRQIVLLAWREIPANRTVRLYVDGDFYSASALRFWMKACRERNDLRVYGYSKSWELFLQLEKARFAWPENYTLNLSSGSKYGKETGKRIARLACVRGDFIAVPVAQKHIANKAYQDKANPGSKEYRREVLGKLAEITSGKRFACPGNCGNCMPNKEHACDSETMAGVTIGIGIHAQG